jgi:putative membrane-bound dehydrogenase-like protein
MRQYRLQCLAITSIAILLSSMPSLAAYEFGSKTTKVGETSFTTPIGIDVEHISGKDLIQWPIAATFDKEGDLVVLECHWRKESVQQQLQSKPHKIVRLRDSDGDGKFDQRLVIADSLPFPEGIEFLGKDLLVSAPPQILKLSDQDGDGVFETRSVWLDPGTITHCANDLHGPLLGPDGWVYWTKGAFAQQELEQKDAPNLSMPSKAAHIYRRHPAGGPVERLMTGGMDNPSDLAFTPDGELFFCSTFLHHPGNGIRDGIAFAPRGSLFGKDHQVIEKHVRTGPLMPVTIELGPAAPASIHFLRTHGLPSALQNRFSERPTEDLANAPLFMVSSQFNLQKIGLHRLVRNGASFTGDSIDLLATDKIDFHPVDVLEASDGSLIVLDTGGWYDLCCPSSGSDQAIAKGGIYRIKFATRSNLPASKLDRKEELWNIAKQFATESAKGKEDGFRLPEDLKGKLERSLRDTDLQQIACRIIGLYSWREFAPQVAPLLNSSSLATVRTAMETLGVIGDSNSSSAILRSIQSLSQSAMGSANDRTLQHAAVYALIEIGHLETLQQAVVDSVSKDVTRIALLAISQMNANLTEVFANKVVELTQATDEDVRIASLRLLQNTPEELARLCPLINDAWRRGDHVILIRNQNALDTMAKTERLQTMILEWLQDIDQQPAKKQDWLASSLTSLPAESLSDRWLDSTLAWFRRSESPAVTEDLAKVISKWRLPSTRFEEVATILELKLEATKSVPSLAASLLGAFPHNGKLKPNMSQWLLEQVTASQDSAMVSPQSLSRVVVDTKVAIASLPQLDRVPSVMFQPTIDLLLRCNDPELDSSLLSKLLGLPLTKTLTSDAFSKTLSGRSEVFKGKWRNMIVEATRPSADIEASLDNWLKRCVDGDPNRGNEVFRSAKAACSSCHRVGYVGGRLGPELSQIGKSRSRRDLIAAIVYPNLHLAQGYYPIRVRTTDDEVFNGLLSRETETHLELICGVDKICRIEKSNIDERAESKVSLMPSGLDQQLSEKDFADLIAFLESKK